FYDVPHLPGAGETLAAAGFSRGLGGKGANMSVAAARAGARVCHIGAVGADGLWAVERLAEYGVDTTFVAEDDAPTGHAVIAVDPGGENLIIILGGANQVILPQAVAAALAGAGDSDTFLTQNETSAQAEAAQMAHEQGLRVAYAAAPFSAEAVEAVLPFLDLLILNEVEAAQLADATGHPVDALPVADVIVTLGARGCRWFGAHGARDFAAHPITPVDTTGAGDTFTGYVVAALDQGQDMAAAIDVAQKAAALMVTRHGTADVIPGLDEVAAAGF
ncbi:MAG: ribokinase, partial [Marinibacterium sp.]